MKAGTVIAIIAGVAGAGALGYFFYQRSKGLLVSKSQPKTVSGLNLRSLN